MHNALERQSSSSQQQRQTEVAICVAGGSAATITKKTPNLSTATTNMAASSMESIGQKLHVLEKRLEEENISHNEMFGGASSSNAATNRNNMVRDGIVGLPSGRTPRPNLSALESTPNRSSMRLPVMSSTNRNAPATEMQNKLKMIRNKSGILTIKGEQFPSKMSDLEHVSDLGNGTSGNVVKMRHKPTGTIIAVKQMRGTGNKEENNRILMDLDVILNSHDCPNIVHCLGYFVNGPDVWICMELMSMCFDKLLKLSRNPVPEDILGKVTVATVRALSYLKVTHNVIHRDVKPSNILIDERGKIKLCDFGISGRLVDSKANTRSAGCAAYMAPERIDPKKPEYDIRADVWSLGITLVELAAGRSPYEGCNIDFEVLTKILDNEPPSLPYGDGFDFTQEFRDFVNKCLTKDYVYRPKYPELLQQPFFRYYDTANVDVAQWFKTVVESAAIETHRTRMPTATAAINNTLRSDATANNKHNRIAPATSITSAHSAVTEPSIAALPLHFPPTINSKLATATPITSHIPSYQNAYQQQQQINLSRYKKDEYLPQYQTHYQQQNQHQQHLQHPHQPSQLPQPVAIYYSNAANNHLHGERVVGGASSGNSYNTGADIGSTSTSPQSPSSSYHKDDTAHIVNEMNKLYRKSPFLQRKYSNGSKYSTGIVGVESPKKESMFSTIGQSIIRNLTTSPFSQKKHHNTTQPHQIDPLWRMPNVHDVGGGVGGNGSNAFGICDTGVAPKILTASPLNARKRFQYNAPAAVTTTTTDAEEHTPTLIPVNRHETSGQRVQGNHSPIVLQRFYHQQNQLREKELERRKEHQKPFAKNYTGNESTNPFHNSQLQYANHYQLPQRQQQQQQQYLSQIPLSSTASSSHSTSSQSSTQSSSSQIAVTELQHQRASTLYSPPPPVPNAAMPVPVNAPSAFGASASQLQYQPLPQQYMPLNAETVRSSRSPPTSPEQTSEGSTVGGNGVASKLGKLYARRQWQTTTAATATTATLSSNVSKEHSYKDEHGWFNSLAGVMKRQFASYVKLQLHSAATPATTHAPAVGLGSSNTTTSLAGKTALPYYRTMSTGSSSNTSNCTSPTEVLPKQCIAAGASACVGNGNGTSAPDFYDGSSSSFLRRYAAAGASGMAVASGAGNAHHFIGLDRRHRSPDPPPRYNRGQSPLLLRKNLLELSGQPPGSPLLNRRFVSASPPLPPPRRGSESVPGSPQHFRTRIHYTPEPQRRIYRTIDQ